MSQPPDPPPVDPRATRDVVVVSFASFLLIGWSGLLVPSLIRQVQGTFDQTDSGMGLGYLLGSLLYVTGTLAAGALAGRMRRPLLLGAGPALIAAGLLVEAAAPTWTVFLAGFLVANLGAGIIDSGVNALGMDLFPGRASMLNRIHLFFAIGAFASPLAVGALVGNGVPWPVVLVGTAVVAAPLAFVLATRSLPPVHAAPPPEPADAMGALVPSGVPTPSGAPMPTAMAAAQAGRGLAGRLPLPLLLLAVAIACYVASEIGVSNWLVRYLDDAPLEVATLALSLFWASSGWAAFVSSFIADRPASSASRRRSRRPAGRDPGRDRRAVAPARGPAVRGRRLRGGAGLPTIMAIGGGLLSGPGDVGEQRALVGRDPGLVVYPPLMGVVSETAGIWWSMFGAALFAFASGAAIAAGGAGRYGGRPACPGRSGDVARKQPDSARHTLQNRGVQTANARLAARTSPPRAARRRCSEAPGSQGASRLSGGRPSRSVAASRRRTAGRIPPWRSSSTSIGPSSRATASERARAVLVGPCDDPHDRARPQVRPQPDDRERLAAVEPERRRALARQVLERQDAHAHEVGAVDPLV